MTDSATPPAPGGAFGRVVPAALPLLLAPLLLLPLPAGPARAQAAFPDIPLWARPGVRVTSGLDTSVVVPKARTVTLRWKRDRRAEARPDFGGYRIYRSTSAPDTGRMVLLRRFSVQVGDEIMWHFSRVDTSTLEFKFGNAVAGDSIVQFVDPDSAGNFVKVCKRVDRFGRCLSIGDSVYKLISPPGPHDGYPLYYTITYEGRNTLDNNYEDLFVPDTLDAPGLTQAERYAACDTVGRPTTCPNENHKARNLIGAPVFPTGGPAPDLERVGVVPNPYRRSEPWDPPGRSEIHFTNLPSQALIRIYTVSGDLVAEVKHDDTIHDFAVWNLKNSEGRDVASGIYIYRVDSGSFSFQNRFVIVR